LGIPSQRLHGYNHLVDLINSRDFFIQWFRGFVDAEGTFAIDRQRDGRKWNLVLKVSVSTYNAKVMRYIKWHLGAAVQLEWTSDGQTVLIRVRDRDLLASIIFPILDAYPLLTSKRYHYEILRSAYNVLENRS